MDSVGRMAPRVDYKKIFVCTNKDLVVSLGRYINKVKYNSFGEIK